MSNRKRKPNESLDKYHNKLKTEQKVIDRKIAGRLLWHPNSGMCFSVKNDAGDIVYERHSKALEFEKTRRGIKTIAMSKKKTD